MPVAGYGVEEPAGLPLQEGAGSWQKERRSALAVQQGESALQGGGAPRGRGAAPCRPRGHAVGYGVAGSRPSR